MAKFIPGLLKGFLKILKIRADCEGNRRVVVFAQ
jgi:hypothetical protein